MTKLATCMTIFQTLHMPMPGLKSHGLHKVEECGLQNKRSGVERV